MNNVYLSFPWIPGQAWDDVLYVTVYLNYVSLGRNDQISTPNKKAGHICDRLLSYKLVRVIGLETDTDLSTNRPLFQCAVTW